MDILDIIGPVMIGPSSSHTAGAVRLGKVGRLVLGEVPQKAKIYLHGSFKETYRGHGTDRALIAGLLGFDTDDSRIRESLKIAEERGLKYEFLPIELPEAHPNTVYMELTGAKNKATITGSSIGGGAVLITGINGYPVKITAKYPTLVVPHADRPGAVAKVTSVLAWHGINIAQMSVSRQQKGAEALMVIETDQPVDEETLWEIKRLPGINGGFTIPPL
ncbi:L-serine ammonia-lyase, iron-sulfur-dependent subunit beta [Carboxydothermus hydrogenoformans]|uniref:L-serine deaminase n=1 Tax=Carboxydothermus hydrogenoformans (strain ATCC BAA-161 / DSM 6008 / Z-2901) TaxID=246194 RepID=Q3A9D2_CARHZ|nr:L-serine ammonia-lyase, iron-sulfur-dependent subunit beta [Carboxydothermus hydrogenoformans]ABB15409.1 L-serine dehydratase, iron-sulfur-dependent, beta subunit [Carboxydothermus hydrogenoformans Z-2901]